MNTFFRALFPLLFTTALAASPIQAAEPGAVAADSTEGQGLYLMPSVGIDVAAYSANVGGGIGFGGGLLGEYFFSPHVGVYLGAGVALRKMTLNSTETVKYFDLPVGLMFQYSLAAGVRNFIGLGLVQSFPLGNFPDSGGAINLNGVTGLDIEVATLFPVSPSVEMGLTGNVRIGFNSPFTPLTNAAVISVQLGLGARFHL